jgi:transcriptional regulator with XRE-family HTH domain
VISRSSEVEWIGATPAGIVVAVAESPRARGRADDRGARQDEPRVTRSLRERAYMAELGQRLRTLREERGLTQQVLAQAAGIATDMVSRLENGHYSSPGLRTLVRIADGMGVAVAAMLPDPPTPSGAPTPETNLRARLQALVQRASTDDLELLVELTAVVVQRKR